MEMVEIRGAVGRRAESRPPPYLQAVISLGGSGVEPAVGSPRSLGGGRGLIENLLRRRYVEIIEYQESQSN